MNDIINWIKENYQNICVIITALVTFCSVVVKITPTKKDDEILAKIINVLDYFSIVNPNHKEVSDK